MSKVIRVVVLCPNGHRVTINLTPNSSILQILEESCKKQSLNPNEFDIYHYTKPLDLTLPVRFANLANNAQLELKPAKNVRKDCLVTVGLQLESGERIMKDFQPSVSVLEVVQECLRNRPEENCDKKGELVCIYMRQKLIGDELIKTTLRSLGLTKGSAIIRLLYRNPDDLSDQAHISSPLSNPPINALNVAAKTEPIEDLNRTDGEISKANVSAMECDPVHQIPNIGAMSKNSVISNNSTNVNLVPANHNLTQNISPVTPNENSETIQKNSNFAFAPFSGKGIALGVGRSNEATSEDQDMDDSTNLEENSVHEDIGAIHYIGQRNAVLYSLDDITDVKKADLPEEFFELTLDDVKYLMEEYKKTRVDIENKPLLTKELRSREILKALGRYKQTVIRVYFPERIVLQAVFEASDTVQHVCDFLKEYLEDEDLDFYLYTAPPKEKKDPTKSLIESMLIPAAVVYFGSNKQLPSCLKKSLQQKISDPRAASLAAYESRQQAISNEFEDSTIDTLFPEVPNLSIDTIMEENRAPGPSTVKLSPSAGKVPKWLKLSKK